MLRLRGPHRVPPTCLRFGWRGCPHRAHRGSCPAGLCRPGEQDLEQDLTRLERSVLDRPADLIVSDTLIAVVVELNGQCGIGGRTDDVLGLMDVRQGMRVGACRAVPARAAAAAAGSPTSRAAACASRARVRNRAVRLPRRRTHGCPRLLPEASNPNRRAPRRPTAPFSTIRSQPHVRSDSSSALSIWTRDRPLFSRGRRSFGPAPCFSSPRVLPRLRTGGSDRCSGLDHADTARGTHRGSTRPIV